jgi:hypothetical protein
MTRAGQLRYFLLGGAGGGAAALGAQIHGRDALPGQRVVMRIIEVRRIPGQRGLPASRISDLSQRGLASDPAGAAAGPGNACPVAADTGGAP